MNSAKACGSRKRPIVSIEADEERADQRALDRADAADDDDDEGEDQHRLAHADLHRLQRADHARRQDRQAPRPARRRCV